MAGELAIVLNEVGNDKVVPKYDGALAFPGGVSTAFAEAMKETLATIHVRDRGKRTLPIRSCLDLGHQVDDRPTWRTGRLTRNRRQRRPAWLRRERHRDVGWRC